MHQDCSSNAHEQTTATAHAARPTCMLCQTAHQLLRCMLCSLGRVLGQQSISASLVGMQGVCFEAIAQTGEQKRRLRARSVY